MTEIAADTAATLFTQKMAPWEDNSNGHPNKATFPLRLLLALASSSGAGVSPQPYTHQSPRTNNQRRTNSVCTGRPSSCTTICISTPPINHLFITLATPAPILGRSEAARAIFFVFFFWTMSDIQSLQQLPLRWNALAAFWSSFRPGCPTRGAHVQTVPAPVYQYHACAMARFEQSEQSSFRRWCRVAPSLVASSREIRDPCFIRSVSGTVHVLHGVIPTALNRVERIGLPLASTRSTHFEVSGGFPKFTHRRLLLRYDNTMASTSLSGPTTRLSSQRFGTPG
ncbi:hypothetical protein A0H81_06157 [Grifola frondosa]|uniref:Uncharacterized protein n=1 Tax=Grifola frondosa TaxID=5627 RepID=A0A1C7M9E6_GRIFR|nr:hypothetical protein A0H81_06157 [Grifola frondosa]